MLVCHCRGLTERDVRRAIESGAATKREVARVCGAGSVCGGCHPVIDELLEPAAAAAPCFARLAFAATG